MHLFGKKILVLMILAAYLLSTSLASAQEEEIGTEIQITKIVADDFPEIVFQVLATDDEGKIISDLAKLILAEDGSEVDNFQVEPVDLGVGLAFVIDTNESIRTKDEFGGLTRLEKVRDSIIRYANFFMNPLPKDRVSILVPDGPGGRWLDKAGLTFQNEVINAINFYQPEDYSEPSLNRMLEQAIDQAASGPDDGRFKAVILFSDAGRLNERLDYESLTERSAEAGVPVFAFLLGNQADSEELAALEALTGPTNGSYQPMPNIEDADFLYQLIDDRSIQQEVGYRSKLHTSGPHRIGVALEDGSDEREFNLVVEPPFVEMAVDNSRPIRRVAKDLDTPLELLTPIVQPLVAQVSWPDGQPRKLTEAALFINGEEVPVKAPVLGDNGVLTFDWDLRNIDEGLYDIQIQVTDELGLVATSDNLPLAVEVERPPEPVPTVTAAPVPTQPPPDLVAPQPEEVSDNVVLAGAGIFFLALFGLLAIVFILFFSWRRKPSKPAAVPAASAEPELGFGGSSPKYTFFLPPEFTTAAISNAYLEVMEHAPEHSRIINISESNVALGRDPRVVQIPFQDRSVSRLHARIMENNGVYRIYDEGSSSGTYVNYERIGLAPRVLNDKDDLHFGRVHLRFRISSSEVDEDKTAMLPQ